MKRFVVELDFFVWGKTEEDAVKMAAEIKNMIRSEYDNTPQITKVYSQDFGKQLGKDIDVFKPPFSDILSGA